MKRQLIVIDLRAKTRHKKLLDIHIEYCFSGVAFMVQSNSTLARLLDHTFGFGNV